VLRVFERGEIFLQNGIFHFVKPIVRNRVRIYAAEKLILTDYSIFSQTI